MGILIGGILIAGTFAAWYTIREVYRLFEPSQTITQEAVAVNSGSLELLQDARIRLEKTIADADEMIAQLKDPNVPLFDLNDDWAEIALVWNTVAIVADNGDELRITWDANGIDVTWDTEEALKQGAKIFFEERLKPFVDEYIRAKLSEKNSNDIGIDGNDVRDVDIDDIAFDVNDIDHIVINDNDFVIVFDVNGVKS